MVLIEPDADPFFATPNDVTWPFQLLGWHKQREAVRDKQRSNDFQRRSGLRNVPNSAVNWAAAELNRSGLQYALTRCDPLFLHEAL